MWMVMIAGYSESTPRCLNWALGKGRLSQTEHWDFVGNKCQEQMNKESVFVSMSFHVKEGRGEAQRVQGQQQDGSERKCWRGDQDASDGLAEQLLAALLLTVFPV